MELPSKLTKYVTPDWSVTRLKHPLKNINFRIKLILKYCLFIRTTNWDIVARWNRQGMFQDCGLFIDYIAGKSHYYLDLPIKPWKWSMGALSIDGVRQ
jgi:hypothetical protein